MPGAQTKYYTRPKAATAFTFRAHSLTTLVHELERSTKRPIGPYPNMCSGVWTARSVGRFLRRSNYESHRLQ